MASPLISKRYVDLLAAEIVRRRPSPGTMPADIRVIKQVLQTKFADKKFVEGLVNEAIGAKGVSIKMG